MDEKFFIKAPATYDNLLAYNLKTRKMTDIIQKAENRNKSERS